MGIINPKATKQFLARKLENWDWLKHQSISDVSETIRALEPRPRFGKGVKLYFHQKICFLLMVYLQRFMLFLDMGCGKTILTLMMMKYLKTCGVKVRAVVFVPYVITVDTWVEECEKWTNLKLVPLIGSGAENIAALQTNPDADLFVVCYQTAVSMMAKKQPGKGKKKVQWELDASTVRKYFKDFNFLAMDEIHRCKNIHSMTYRMCRAVSTMPNVEWAYGLTGTPFGKEVEALWAEFYLIDHGETLGETLGLFRGAFFNQTINYWGGWEYKFKKKLHDTLHNMLKNRSIRFEIDECHDMPPKSYVPRYVKATDDVAAYYDKIIEAYESLSFGKIKYQELESATTKLRQLASGFMTLKGNDDSKAQIKFPVNPKLDVLQEIIEGMIPDSKIIIFHDYRFTNGLISERLKQMKIPHARVWGDQNGKKNLLELRKFKKDPKCRAIIINDKSGSSSQNLQMANYVCFFEQPRSAIDRQQAERRAWRPGQNKRVFFFDLLMKGTVDERQHKSNQEGKDLLKSVLDGKLKLKRLRK